MYNGWQQRHMRVNNLPKVVAQKRNDRESKRQPRARGTGNGETAAVGASLSAAARFIYTDRQESGICAARIGFNYRRPTIHTTAL